MGKSNSRKTSKAKSTEQIYQELDDILTQAQRKETLTAMVGVVLNGLRLLGKGIIRMLLEQRDNEISEKRKGPPCCSKCGDKMRKPNKKKLRE